MLRGLAPANPASYLHAETLYANAYSMDAFPDGTLKSYRSESASQGTQWTATASANWSDWRGTTNSPKVYHLQLRPNPLAD